VDLFELLLLAFFFIILPILDGIGKKRRKGQGKGQGTQARSGPSARPEREVEEPRSAAEMLPEDLWGLITGEKRDTPEPVTRDTETPWSEAPGTSRTPTAEAGTEGFGGWEPEPWMDAEETYEEPVSLEYQGPEAYSLEAPVPPARSLEQPLPSPEARHRAFHAKIDRPPKRRMPARSPLMQALRHPDGLRQAVLLKEILGRPRGLE
jgi:hypothetical protein